MNIIQTQLMRINLPATLIILIMITGTFQGCMKRCGCDADPHRSVKSVNARYYYGFHIHFFDTPELHYVICNEDAIPAKLQMEAKNAGLIGIDVIVGGDLHSGCIRKPDNYIPNGITITEISRVNN